MGRQRISISGEALADIFSSHDLPPRMRADLSRVAHTDSAVIQTIVTQLQRENGFIGIKQMIAIVATFVEDQDTARAIVASIRNLRHLSADHILSRVKSWLQASPENNASLSSELVDSLEVNLKLLGASIPAFERTLKAEQLQESTGTAVNEVSIICDIRPVFDESRSIIEGFMPIVTLTISASEELGNTETYEVTLNRQDLIELRKLSDRALTKLETLSGWIRNPYTVAEYQGEDHG